MNLPHAKKCMWILMLFKIPGLLKRDIKKLFHSPVTIPNKYNSGKYSKGFVYLIGVLNTVYIQINDFYSRSIC